MKQQHWLVKQEPSSYGWREFEAEKRTDWSGVRNFQARNHLRGMKKGDWVLFYHSGDEKQVVGLARVVREAYPDPTAEEGDWSTVDLEAVMPLRKPVPLATIKQDASLREILLVRNSRLSVISLTPPEFARLLELSDTRLPR